MKGMYMECSVAIQHADFVSDELGVLPPSEIFARLMSVVWEKEVFRFSEMYLLQKKTCPPGFYIYRPSQEYLACYPVSESRFLLNFCLVSGKTLLGRERLKELMLQPAKPEKVRELIDAFTTLDSDELLQRLGLERLA